MWLSQEKNVVRPIVTESAVKRIFYLCERLCAKKEVGYLQRVSAIYMSKHLQNYEASQISGLNIGYWTRTP